MRPKEIQEDSRPPTGFTRIKQLMAVNKRVLAGVVVVCLIVLVNYGIFSGYLTAQSQQISENGENDSKLGTTEKLLRLFKLISQNNQTDVKIPEQGAVTIPTPSILENMKREELEELYFSYIENIQKLCVRQRHIGNEKDGGYHICEDIMEEGKPCLMYSFGNRKDFSFDDGVSSQYGCHVHSFDPFDGQVDHQHSSKVTFHSLGIGGKDDPQGKILTVNTIKNNLNHSEKTIDIIKIDVEGAEWDSLTEMCNGHVLESVKILIVEFHICIQDCLDGRHRKKEQYVQYLSVLKRLYDIGFRVYFFRMWPYCHFVENGVTHTTCHEVHMMRSP